MELGQDTDLYSGYKAEVEEQLSAQPFTVTGDNDSQAADPSCPSDSFITDYMKYAKISNGTKPTVSGILKTNAYSPIYLASRTQIEVVKVSLVGSLPT